MDIYIVTEFVGRPIWAEDQQLGGPISPAQADAAVYTCRPARAWAESIAQHSIAGRAQAEPCGVIWAHMELSHWALQAAWIQDGSQTTQPQACNGENARNIGGFG